MAITTVASEKAIYKKALFDWLTSLALIFLLHYMARGIIWINDILVDILFDVSDSNQMKALLKSFNKLVFSPDFIVGWGSVIVYVMLTIQTLMFLITYIKRMLTLAFLIIISPLITITYSIDKMGDQKAQALNTWLKEFIYNVLIQPFHCILYLVFVGTAITAVSDGGSLPGALLAILAMKFVWDGEKIVKKIFGFEQASSLGAVAASGAVIGAALSKMKSAGSAASSGIKFAKNTKTGQLMKQKMGQKFGQQKQMRGLTRAGKAAVRGVLLDKTLTDEEKAKKIEQHKETHKSKISKVKDSAKTKVNKSIPVSKMRDAIDKSKLGEKIQKVKDSDAYKAITTDAKRFTRKMVDPSNVAKIGGAVFGAAAMYQLPESNLLTAAGAGMALGKAAESKVREIQDRKKEHFEDNVQQSWNRHCAINNIPESKRTQQAFKDWYKSSYLNGKERDVYSVKNMNKEKGDASEKLADLKLDSGDISNIIARLEKSILDKKDYDPSKMFDGFGVDAAAIAAAVSGYASKFNDSYIYQNATAYNAQMNPFGITHEDAVSGIIIPEPRKANSEKQEIIENEVSNEIETIMADPHSPGSTDDIYEKLKGDIEKELSDIRNSMTATENQFRSQIQNLDTDNVIAEIKSNLDRIGSDLSKDATAEIQSLVNSLHLSGDAAQSATTFATQYIETTKIVEKVNYITNNQTTIKNNITQKQNSNS